MICGEDFEYKAGVNQAVDFDLFGGSICSHCRKRGLNHFLGAKKTQLKEEMNDKLNQYATEIRQNRSLEGDWWDKNSPLFKTLMGVKQ